MQEHEKTSTETPIPNFTSSQPTSKTIPFKFPYFQIPTFHFHFKIPTPFFQTTPFNILSTTSSFQIFLPNLHLLLSSPLKSLFHFSIHPSKGGARNRDTGCGWEPGCGCRTKVRQTMRECVRHAEDRRGALRDGISGRERTGEINLGCLGADE